MILGLLSAAAWNGASLTPCEVNTRDTLSFLPSTSAFAATDGRGAVSPTMISSRPTAAAPLSNVTSTSPSSAVSGFRRR